jgi:hypothetical protein
MGIPAAVLREQMTESEFQAHRAQMVTDPDAGDRIVYLLKLAVPLLASLVNAWGGSVRLSERNLDPWKSARDAADTDRVAMWAMTAFGFEEGVNGN